VPNVDGVIAQRHRFSARPEDGRPRQTTIDDSLHERQAQVRVRLHRDDLRRFVMEPFNVEASPRAAIEEHLPSPRRDPAHRRLDDAIGISGAVLDLVEVRVLGDVQGPPSSGRLTPGVRHLRAILSVCSLEDVV